MSTQKYDPPNFPVLHQADVRQALDSLLYRTRPLPDDNPLFNLSLLRQNFSPHWTSSSIQKMMALSDLLTTSISNSYRHHRRIRQFPLPDIQSTLADTEIVLQLDVQSGSVELMSWSWLYHRYVRVDLDIEADTFSQMCNITQRTLRRYTKHGVWRLTERIIRQECELLKDLAVN